MALSSTAYLSRRPSMPRRPRAGPRSSKSATARPSGEVPRLQAVRCYWRTADAVARPAGDGRVGSDHFQAVERGWVVLDGAKPAARKAALTDEGRRLARRGRWRSDRGSGPAQRWSSAPTTVCAAGSSLSRRCSGRLTLAECDLPPCVVGISNANQNLCFCQTYHHPAYGHRIPPLAATKGWHLASVQFPRHSAIAHKARCPEFLNHACQSPGAQVSGNHVR